jgi:hypothetical protein
MVDGKQFLSGCSSMLIAIFVLVVLLWLVGVLMAYTLGGLIHLLLLLAAIIMLIEYLERRKVF